MPDFGELIEVDGRSIAMSPDGDVALLHGGEPMIIFFSGLVNIFPYYDAYTVAEMFTKFVAERATRENADAN